MTNKKADWSDARVFITAVIIGVCIVWASIPLGFWGQPEAQQGLCVVNFEEKR